MSTQDEKATSVAPADVTPHKAEPLPKPPMLWLLIPTALLALLAFLSRS
jgi:hypothetical protein